MIPRELVLHNTQNRVQAIMLLMLYSHSSTMLLCPLIVTLLHAES